MNELLSVVQGLLGVKFQNLTPALALQLGLKLAGIVPDLLHLPPDHELSPESRLLIEDAIAQFEQQVGL